MKCLTCFLWSLKEHHRKSVRKLSDPRDPPPILTGMVLDQDQEIMGLQSGEMGEHNLGVFLDFLVFFIIFYGIFGVSIIPKWLINDS